jgi:hypothetical protein
LDIKNNIDINATCQEASGLRMYVDINVLAGISLSGEKVCREKRHASAQLP